MTMSDLSAGATLDRWQAAEALPPVERALVLASTVDETTVEELARLPLGRRDARILRLLQGQALEATATCPACGEQAQFAVDAEALLARAEEAVEPAPVELDGLVLAWRPPDSDDVSAAAAAGDLEGAERVLLGRCVSGVADGALPAEARAAVADAMARADPLAEVLVDVGCPACGHDFVSELDVSTFAWAELRRRARALLEEVDVLARAYGWTEAEVLALDERRRAAYLELAER
jgi:hypothetical protein